MGIREKILENPEELGELYEEYKRSVSAFETFPSIAKYLTDRFNPGGLVIVGPKAVGKTTLLIRLRENALNCEPCSARVLYVSYRDVAGEISDREDFRQEIENVLDAYVGNLVFLFDDFLDMGPAGLRDFLYGYLSYSSRSFIVLTGSDPKNLKEAIKIASPIKGNVENRINLLLPSDFQTFAYYKLLERRPDSQRDLPRGNVIMLGIRKKAGYAKINALKYIATASLAEYLSKQEASRGEHMLNDIVSNLAVLEKKDSRNDRILLNKRLQRLLENYIGEGNPRHSAYPAALFGNNYDKVYAALNELFDSMDPEEYEVLATLYENAFKPAAIDTEDELVMRLLSRLIMLPFKYLDDPERIVPIPVDRIVLKVLEDRTGTEVSPPSRLTIPTALHYLRTYAIRVPSLERRGRSEPVKVPLEIGFGYLGEYEVFSLELAFDPYVVDVLALVVDDNLFITGYQKKYSDIEKSIERYKGLVRELALYAYRRATTPVMLVRGYDYDYDLFTVAIDPSDEDDEAFRMSLKKYLTYGTFPEGLRSRKVRVFPAHTFYTLLTGIYRSGSRRGPR